MSAPQSRIQALDTLRGLIMVLMALDHASYFVSRVHPFEYWNLPPPAYGDGVWFLTRWVTHLCAPGFFFLMGAGMALMATSRSAARWSAGTLTRFWLKRGLLLCALFYFVEAPAWILGSLTGQPSDPARDPSGQMPLIPIGVLVSLGLTMAFGHLLMRLPVWTWAPVGVLAALAPAAFISSGAGASGAGPLTRILLLPGDAWPVMSLYPLLPWFGICALGMAFGRAVRNGSEGALRRSLYLGFAGLGVYGLIRLAGGSGTFWQVSPDGWIGLLAVVKYPPSPAFVALMLGLNLVLLGLIHRTLSAGQRLHTWLAIFGRAPLLFYLAHLYVFAFLAATVFRGGPPPRWGLYAVWLAGCWALYPACKAYERFKHSKPRDSLWRLL